VPSKNVSDVLIGIGRESVCTPFASIGETVMLSVNTKFSDPVERQCVKHGISKKAVIYQVLAEKLTHKQTYAKISVRNGYHDMPGSHW